MNNDIWCSACGALEFTPCKCPSAVEESIEKGYCPGCDAGSRGGPDKCVCRETEFNHMVDDSNESLGVGLGSAAI